MASTSLSTIDEACTALGTVQSVYCAKSIFVNIESLTSYSLSAYQYKICMRKILINPWRLTFVYEYFIRVALLIYSKVDSYAL